MNQKEEEKLVMQYFRESWNDFPKGKLVVSESPDFILRINPKKTIGIELTSLPGSDSFTDSLNEILEKKEQKLRLYMGQGFVQIWLIIYTDDITKISKYNFRNKISNLHFPSSFDKVFLFDLFEKEAHSIK